MTARLPIARTVAGLALVAVGVLLWAGYHVVARGEAHSYTDGAAPPAYVTLHAGARYTLGYPGGRPAAERQGVSPDALTCTATPRGGAPTRLQVAAEASGTKATTQIASFRAPFGGPARVRCAGLSPVYVDNATGDPSGYLLVLATIALAVGVPVLLSAGRLVLAGRAPAEPEPAA